MRQKPGTPKPSADRVVRDICCKTRKRHSVEEKIRIVLEMTSTQIADAEKLAREWIPTP
jgi:transposase